MTNSVPTLGQQLTYWADIDDISGPSLLLTLINFNPGMDK